MRTIESQAFHCDNGQSDPKMTATYYDYDNQCWVVDCKVQACAHPKKMNCKCYGKLHAGEYALPQLVGVGK